MDSNRVVGASRAGLFVLVSAFAAACGGGGSGAGATLGVSAGAGDFLIQDAPVSSLLAFSATVNEVHLETTGGTSANLLPAPLAVEFLGLQGTPAWLSTVDTLPLGTYTGVRIVFAPSSAGARANDGTDVAVSALSNSMTLPFASPLVVDGTGYHRFEVDLDLVASLTGDVASPPLTFDPSGLAKTSSGTQSVEMDEFRGVLHSADPGTSSFIVDAFADDDLTLPLGQVTVRLQGSTLMHMDNGSVYAGQPAFFADLSAGNTLLEIHGDLGANRVVTASKVDVEDQTAGASSSGLVKIEGLVAAITPGVSFDLTIGEIEKGSAIADPVLLGLGSPATVTVSFDGSTAWFLHGSTVSSSAALAVGQKVKVRFSAFNVSPFPATKVEIRHAFPEFEGTMTNPGGLPGSMTMHLDALDPGVLSGQVQSSSTDVMVDMGGSTLVLDTPGEPSMVGVALLAGLQFEVKGTLSGSPSAPTLTAGEAKIRPGRMRAGRVSSMNQGGLMFQTSSGTVKDPFGGGLSSGPMTVILDPACVYEGDAMDRSGFFSGFAGMGMGMSMMVDVKGVATANPNEIRAYEIDTTIQ